MIPAALPGTTAITNGAPALLIFDRQQRISKDGLWAYLDTAQRIVSTEQLNQLSNLTMPWMPDKGDLIVHQLAIIRDGQTIDLLAGGKKFTILRREQSLEQRELTGILTATMAVEGLRVGDILRFRASTTSKDKALAGNVQSLSPILSAPISLGQGRLRTLWDDGIKANWKLMAGGITGKPVHGKGFTELTLTLPAAKQPEIPSDAPIRFRPFPVLEVSTFADWADVSKSMAKLFSTDGLIAPGSALAAEADAIRKADAGPLGRAQKALQLVQDKIRYLAVSMDGGNYIPQTPEQTWALRYGDCKAKTLLLVALLRELGIEAEPILAHTELGDLVVNRLPAPAAFNHILVRAVVDGKSLWMDGTGLGARQEDIYDTPPFRNVLPLRPEGATLMRIEPHKDGRPTFDIAMSVDESTSADLPSAFDINVVLRGGPAIALNVMRSQLDAKKQREVFSQFLARLAGDAMIGDLDVQADDKAGQITIRGRGVLASAWRWDDKTLKRQIDRGLDSLAFDPDRARAAWQSIPVATPAPQGRRLRMQIRLPDGGKDFRLDGQPVLNETIAGYEIARAIKLDQGKLLLDERVDATGAEIPAAQVSTERDRLASARAGAPQLVAPAKALRRWDVAARDVAGATQIAAAEAVFARKIANDPDEVAGYRSRGFFRRQINDGKGALADLTKALSIEPDLQLYMARSSLYEEQGNFAAALTDAEAARQLDPASIPATIRTAYLRAERGNLKSGVDLVDQRIALGGEQRVTYNEAKADLIGRFGDPAEALKLVETLMADRPGTSTLLNMRCWIKSTRQVAVDTAVKDCTQALEVSSSPYPILDSRALASYRMGRYDDAMRDLDAVLNAIPSMAESRFMRGVVLARMDRKAESASELDVARRLKPGIDEDYARFGIKP